MTKTLRCEDLGWDCRFAVIADTDDDIVEHTIEHAHQVHRLEDATKALRGRIRDAIHEV